MTRRGEITVGKTRSLKIFILVASVFCCYTLSHMPNKHTSFYCSADTNRNIIAKGKCIHPKIFCKYFYGVLLQKGCVQFSEAFSVRWFWKVSRKKCLQFVCPGRNQGTFYYLKWCSHYQIKPNAIKLLLSTGLSSCIIAVLSFNQSCVSAKIPFECFNSQKPVENWKAFLFVLHGSDTTTSTDMTLGNFLFLKSRSFTSRRKWN